MTAAGIGFNRLPIAELGAAYTAVPIARFVGGLLPAPTGFAGARFAAPGGFPTGLIVNGRIGPVGATVSGVKTF